MPHNLMNYVTSNEWFKAFNVKKSVSMKRDIALHDNVQLQTTVLFFNFCLRKDSLHGLSRKIKRTVLNILLSLSMEKWM